MTSNALSAPPAKAKRGRPLPPAAWNWICVWARSQGLDPELVPFAAATPYLLSTLERYRDTGLTLPPARVRLASLLLAIHGKLVIQGAEPTWESAQPFLDQAYVRDRAQVLRSMRDNQGWSRPQPQILEPEPIEEPPAVTLWDMVRTFQQILEQAQKPRAEARSLTPPLESSPGPTGPPVAAIKVQSHD